MPGGVQLRAPRGEADPKGAMECADDSKAAVEVWRDGIGNRYRGARQAGGSYRFL
ncbi:hypothetical protein D3C73_1668200 [compost metagenome]